MDQDEIVCSCLNITNGMIKDAIDNGAATVQEVQDITGAGTICGACLEDIEHLVKLFTKEK